MVSSQPKKLTGTLLAIETAQVLARAWSHPDQLALAQLSPTQTAMGFGVDASLPIPPPLTLEPKPSGSPPREMPPLTHSQLWPTMGSSPQKPRPSMDEEAAAAVEGQFEAFKAVHLENMLDGHNNQQAVAARLRAFEATKSSIIVQTQAAARWLAHNKGNFPPATSPFASSPLEAACPPISSAGAPPVFPSSGLNTNVPALPSDLASVPAVLAAWSRPGTPGARSSSPVHLPIRPRSTTHSNMASPTSLATPMRATRDASPTQPVPVAPTSLMTPLSLPASSSAETNASTRSATHTGLFAGRTSPVLAPSLLTSPPASLSPVARGTNPPDLQLDGGNAALPPVLHLSSPKDSHGTPTGQSTGTGSALSVRRSVVPSQPCMATETQPSATTHTGDSSVTATPLAPKTNEPVYFNFERSADQSPHPVGSPLDYFNASTPMASPPYTGGPDLQQVDPQLQFHYQRVATPVAALRLGAGINDDASNIVSKPLQSRPLSAAPVAVSKPTKGSRPATGNVVTPSNIKSLPEHQAVIGTAALTREDLLDSDSDEEHAADAELAHPRFVPLNALLAMRETIMKHRPLQVIIQRMWQVSDVGLVSHCQ